MSSFGSHKKNLWNFGYCLKLWWPSYPLVSYGCKKMEIPDGRTTISKINLIFAIIDIILNIGMVGANVCIFYGVHNKEDKFLLPLIWFLHLIVRCLFVFVLIINFGNISQDSTLSFASLFSFNIIYYIIFLSSHTRGNYLPTIVKNPTLTQLKAT